MKREVFVIYPSSFLYVSKCIIRKSDTGACHILKILKSGLLEEPETGSVTGSGFETAMAQLVCRVCLRLKLFYIMPRERVRKTGGARAPMPSPQSVPGPAYATFENFKHVTLS